MSIPLIVPPHTPMHADGSINLDAVPAQAEWFNHSGAAKVFVCGSTGEGQSLTTPERIDLLEAWVAAGKANDLPVIAQVGHAAVTEAVALAKHAADAGADAVSACAPYYFRPATVEALIDTCAAIAGAAPNLPFYFYHIPSLTGVDLSMVEFLKAGSLRIPNLAGIKYTSTNFAELQRCVHLEQGTFELLLGYDEFFSGGSLLGVKGAVGSSYNFAAPIYIRILAALHARELEAARELQGLAVDLIHGLDQFGYLPAAKYTMSLLGIDCGPVRAPLRNLTDEDKAGIKAFLDELDFFALVKGVHE